MSISGSSVCVSIGRGFALRPSLRKRAGFTLIELLIVVAIIGILAAIALPNFIQAQTRAKVARVQEDIHSVATAIEMYRTDQNAYPPGYKCALRYGPTVLTTPVAYLTDSTIVDPFVDAQGIDIGKRQLTYELMTSTGQMLESPSTAPYSIDPTNTPNAPQGCWWWLASRGPDKKFGSKPGEPEYDFRQRFYAAGSNPQGLLDIVYDPTNGVYSFGNIYGLGGSEMGPAGRLILSCNSH